MYSPFMCIKFLIFQLIRTWFFLISSYWNLNQISIFNTECFQKWIVRSYIPLFNPTILIWKLNERPNRVKKVLGHQFLQKGLWCTIWKSFDFKDSPFKENFWFFLVISRIQSLAALYDFIWFLGLISRAPRSQRSPRR